MKNMKALSKLELAFSICIVLAIFAYLFSGSSDQDQRPEITLTEDSEQMNQKSMRASFDLHKKLNTKENDQNTNYTIQESEEQFEEQNFEVVELLNEFHQEGATTEEKTDVLKKLIKMPFVAVLPNILPAILQYSESAIDHPNCESQVASELCMSLAVWSLHMKNPEFAEEKGVYFMELLNHQEQEQTATPFMTKLILDSLALNWIAPAGEPVANILSRDDLDLSTKLRATTLLIGKSDLDYAELISDAAKKSPSDERSKYLSKILWHAKFSPMQPEFVRLTFETMQEHDTAKNGPINAYGLVKQTAEYLTDTSKTHDIDSLIIDELRKISTDMEQSGSIDQKAAMAAGAKWWENYGHMF